RRLSGFRDRLQIPWCPAQPAPARKTRNRMTVPRKEQFSGCLIGQCLGDALGCPVEGQRPQGAAGYVSAFLRTTLVGSFGRPGYAFGQYTDDSQLGRELMQSYVACRGFDPQDYA